MTIQRVHRIKPKSHKGVGTLFALMVAKIQTRKQEFHNRRKGHIVAPPHLFFRMCVKKRGYLTPSGLTKKSNNRDLKT